MITSYDWKEIGERIRKERKDKHIHLEPLANAIGTTRQTLSRWEKGEGVEVTVNMLLNLCNVFNCEMGYLLGEHGYELKTRTATAFQKETGLSVLAVTNLYIAAMSPSEAPLCNDVLSNHGDRLRDFEIGRFAKIRFLEALLENYSIFEKIAVCAYDYLDQMRRYNIDRFHTVAGIRHDQLAGLAKKEAQEALAQLFNRIVEQCVSDEKYYKWTGE